MSTGSTAAPSSATTRKNRYAATADSTSANTATASSLRPSAQRDSVACALGGLDEGQLFEPGVGVPFATIGASMDATDVPWGTQRLRPSTWNVELLSDSGATAIADGS